MGKSYEMDLCSGPLLRRILLFALPLLCAGVLQLLFNAADIVVVGRFAGGNAMAAVGATTSLINLLVNFFIGISVGANVLIARCCGARSYDDAQQTVQTALCTAAAGGAALLVIGITAARPMLEWMDTPADVLDQAVLYMRLYFLGMPAALVYNFGAAILRAVGDTRRPLYFLMLSGVINVGCNLVFVIVLHMGVAGVALATVLAQMLAAGLILYCLTQLDGMCHVELRALRFYRDKFMCMMQIGLPAGLQSVIFNISNVLIQSSVNSFGAVVVAGNTAAANIEGFVYISMNALYQTSLSFTSQNMGARQYKRIDRIFITCMVLVAVVGLVLGNSVYLFGNQLLSIYSDDAAVVASGMIRLSMVAVTYFLCGMMEVASGSVRGMGYSVLPMLVSLVGACLLRIVWLFTIFRVEHTLVCLYLSYPVSWVLTVCAHVVCYLIVRARVRRQALG